MPPRNRVIDSARYRARLVRSEIGGEIRAARTASGLTLRTVSQAVGRSPSWLSRAERGLSRTVTVDEMIVTGSAVGLRVWIGTFPAARAIRDAPQADLLQRLRRRIGAGWTWRYEVPIPRPGDQRAADAVIRHGSITVMVEAFTRLADVQAQLRAVQLKARDMSADRVLVCVSATHANRRAMRAAAEIIAAEFPIGSRAMLAALARGADPGGNGVIAI